MTQLFGNGDIFSVLEGQKAALAKGIDDLKPDYVLQVSEADCISYLVDLYRLDVPVLLEDQIHVEGQQETSVDVTGRWEYGPFDTGRVQIPGTATTIVIPFDGNAEFFFIRPQTYTYGPPKAEVQKDHLRLTFVRTDTNGTALKADFDKSVAYFKEALERLKSSTVPFNAELPALAGELLRKRKQRLLEASGMVAYLGIPIKQRDGIPATYAVPVQRKAPIAPPKVLPGGFKPEPALASTVYDEILTVIKNMVRVMEYSPGAFAKMGEEDLRTHFLVQLNGHFEGQATGETFNYEGKTDILIKADGRNIFIGECKFWKGEKAFTETIDQLLSYLSWRDTKAAVLMFSRNTNFTDVLNTIEGAVPKHSHFKRQVSKDDESTYRYVFGHPEDPNRELLVAIMAFNIPVKS